MSVGQGRGGKTKTNSKTKLWYDIEIQLEHEIENKIENESESVIGIFDPEENNFNLDMWSNTDGTEIKKILKRINKLKLSKLSEDLLFQVLFTNAYAPKNNLDSNEFPPNKVGL